MRKSGYWTAVLVVGLLVALLGGKPASAQEDSTDTEHRLYFPETRHSVGGEFREFYIAVPDPELVYGLPITEHCTESTKGRIVQYFEKARFEFVPDNPPELRVVLTDLGKLLYEPGQSLPALKNHPDCRYFPEMKTSVCFAFREFFEAHGGVAQFGYPISNFEIHNGIIVQYFQRARFEWHRELPEGERVQLTDLGEKYFARIKEDPSCLIPVDDPNNNRPHLILALNTRAYPESPFTQTTASQAIHIVVQDQYNIPVADAKVTLSVKLPDGRIQELELPGATDKNGFIHYTFSFENQTRGVVEVQVITRFADLQSRTNTSFRIW